ncbi:MAG: malto-oligosyltrehalose trehalohydrolase [Syntrophales bacterium]|nr:malto-oligosyltrehalose trehalohydrolase [Syntrophales bacterium]
MALLEVWAPDSKKVEVQWGQEVLSMIREEKGWWRLDAEGGEHGSDYAFFLDGEGPFPDPRSLWQPQGVHGPSRTYDHTRFKWNDMAWHPPPLSSSIIYELHVGTFSPDGTFEGVVNRLDYLVDLGITHLEIMPVNGFSGIHGWGYDGVNLYAPHEPYGGPAGYKRLVNACHERGLAVILDVVYNHFGPEGNYLGKFGPYTTGKYRQPWGEAVNVDGPRSDEVRRFICDNAIMWFRDYHVDALRIDAIDTIIDISALNILEEMAIRKEEIQAELGRYFFLIAESALNNPRIVKHRETGGYGLDAQWNDDYHHCVHTVLTGEKEGYYIDFGSLQKLAKALSETFVFDGAYSMHRGRSHGKPAGDLPGSRFIVFLQNHDQVGNRAFGERLGRLVTPGLLKIGAALVMLSPFIPLIFQGEEWNASTPFLYFTDHADPELAKAVAEGRKEEFASFKWKKDDVPNPQAPESFQDSKLNWKEKDEKDHSSFLDWYRKLMKLRKSVHGLSSGRKEKVRISFDENAKWLHFEREQFSVACNFSKKSQIIEIGEKRSGKVILASDDRCEIRECGMFLPPESVAVLGPPGNRI